MAVKISPDGSYSEVELATGSEADEQIRRLVGGWFEVVGLGDGVYMAYAEDGKRRHFPRNDQATLYAARVLAPGGYIAGVALLVSRQDLGY